MRFQSLDLNMGDNYVDKHRNVKDKEFPLLPKYKAVIDIGEYYEPK